MRNNDMNKMKMIVLSMFLIFSFYAPATFASNNSTSFNLDTFFGHHGPADYSQEMHDSEWPTEEQPGTVQAAPAEFHVEDDHDSEWPTEEQPGDQAPSVPTMNMHKEDPYS